MEEEHFEVAAVLYVLKYTRTFGDRPLRCTKWFHSLQAVEDYRAELLRKGEQAGKVITYKLADEDDDGGMFKHWKED